MSISRCPHCDNEYDQDFNVEHEEVCAEENLTEEWKQRVLDNLKNVGDYDTN